MRVLVVGAHPDDETLGAGGTVRRAVDRGHEVSLLVLGEGATSRAPSRELGDTTKVGELVGQCRAAAGLLGIADVEFAGLADNRFDGIDLLDIVKTVEAAIDRVQPELVLTHSGSDLNIDHTITSRAVVTATRPVTGCPVRTVLAFEVPSATEWSFQGEGFRPSVFVDIGATLDTKLAALRSYDAETRPPPHPRSAQAIRALAQVRGATAGLEAAESFELIRTVIGR